MILLVPILLGSLGLVSLFSRTSMMGILIGVQLLILGTSQMFILTGMIAGELAKGGLLGFCIVLGGVAQLVVGYTLSLRLFHLKQCVNLSEIQELKK